MRNFGVLNGRLLHLKLGGFIFLNCFGGSFFGFSMWVFHGENCVEDSKKKRWNINLCCNYHRRGWTQQLQLPNFLKVHGGSVWCAVCLSQISIFWAAKKKSVSATLTWLNFWGLRIFTPWKFQEFAPENLPGPKKERQNSLPTTIMAFRGKLAVKLRGCTWNSIKELYM